MVDQRMPSGKGTNSATDLGTSPATVRTAPTRVRTASRQMVSGVLPYLIRSGMTPPNQAGTTRATKCPAPAVVNLPVPDEVTRYATAYNINVPVNGVFKSAPVAIGVRIALNPPPAGRLIAVAIGAPEGEPTRIAKSCRPDTCAHSPPAEASTK